MKRFALVAALVLFGVIAATPAHSQINSPPPALMGQPSFHLYSVPGVIASLSVHTFFGCTNTTSVNIRVGVETFLGVGGPGSNDPSGTSLDIPPGGSRIFGTSQAIGISVASVVGGFQSNSARILATARSGIICSAFLADPGNSPPTSMTALTIVKQNTLWVPENLSGFFRKFCPV